MRDKVNLQDSGYSNDRRVSESMMNRYRLHSAEPAIAYKRVDVHALALLALLALSLFAGALMMRNLIMAPVGSDAAQFQTVTIGGSSFQIRRDWLFDAATSGDRHRISLRMRINDLLATDMADPNAIVSLVFMTSDQSLAPSERAKKLYSRFLSSEAAPSAGGLIRRQFRTGTPYEGETLFLSPPEGRAFAARCPTSDGSGIPLPCHAEIRHAGFDIQIQMARRDLPLWENILTRVRAMPDRAR